MIEEQKQKIIELTTELQLRCIAYGRAAEHHDVNDTFGTKKWLDQCYARWRKAEDDLREYLDQA